MYVSPTSEGDVRALLIPVVHTLDLLTYISAGRLPHDEFSREFGGKLRPALTRSRFHSAPPCRLMNALMTD